MNYERLDRIISSYCEGDDEMYNEIATEISKYNHSLNTPCQMDKSDLSYNALACITEWEDKNEQIKEYEESQSNRYYGSLIHII
jgi:hypothetical protein